MNVERTVLAVLVAVTFGVVFDWRVGVAFYAGSLWPTIVAPVLTSRAKEADNVS